jgi:hypothetical protein
MVIYNLGLYMYTNYSICKLDISQDSLHVFDRLYLELKKLKKKKNFFDGFLLFDIYIYRIN